MQLEIVVDANDLKEGRSAQGGGRGWLRLEPPKPNAGRDGRQGREANAPAGASFRRRHALEPRNFHAALLCDSDGLVVAGVDVAQDTHAWVAREHAFDSFGRGGRTVGDDDLARV